MGPRPRVAQQVLADLGNVVILERPINDPRPCSAASPRPCAPASRQYIAREHLEERRQFAETLEKRIAERTADLALANERLRREIDEKERMHAVLVQSQKMEAVRPASPAASRTTSTHS